MDDDPSALGRGNINYYSSLVAEGTATPDDAKRLLVEFVRQAGVDTSRVDPLLIEHLRDCVSVYLSGRRVLPADPRAGRDKPYGVAIKTLEKAFGLTRIASGQPRVDEEVVCFVAADVLAAILSGKSVDEASYTVASARRAKKLPISSESQVIDAWSDHKQDALVYLRISRHARAIESADPSDGRWTDGELERLYEIFADVPGIILPGEKFGEGRHKLP
jgi:hypothetical protein